MSRTDEGHVCMLCGRRCRSARSVCSTCREGTGLHLMGRRARGWSAHRYYPVEWRRSWADEVVREGHATYARGPRDPLTVALESEYQHRARVRRQQCRRIGGDPAVAS